MSITLKLKQQDCQLLQHFKYAIKKIFFSPVTQPSDLITNLSLVHFSKIKATLMRVILEALYNKCYRYKQQLIWNTYWNHWNTFSWALLLFHTAHSHGQTKEKEMKFISAHFFCFINFQ